MAGSTNNTTTAKGDNPTPVEFHTGSVGRKMTDLLEENGMFRAQAIKVVSTVHCDQTEAISEALDKQVKGYPDSLIDIAWVIVKKAAVKWIEENCPAHWAKPMFES